MAVIPPPTQQPAVKSIANTIKNNVQAQVTKQTTPIKSAPAPVIKTTSPIISGNVPGAQNGTYTLPDGSVHPSYGGAAPVPGAVYTLYKTTPIKPAPSPVTNQHGVMNLPAPKEMTPDQAKQQAQDLINKANGGAVLHSATLDTALAKNGIVISGYNTKEDNEKVLANKGTSPIDLTTLTKQQGLTGIDTTKTTTPVKITPIPTVFKVAPTPFTSGGTVNKPADIKVPSNAPSSVTKMLDQYKKDNPNGVPSMAGTTQGIVVYADGKTGYMAGGAMNQTPGATYYKFDGTAYTVPANINQPKTGPVMTIPPIERSPNPVVSISPIERSPNPIKIPTGNAGYKTLEGNIANALTGTGSLSSNNVHIGSVQKDITNALTLGSSKLTTDETTALKNAQSFLNSASTSGQNAMGKGLNIAQARTEMNKAAGMLGIKQANPVTPTPSTSTTTKQVVGPLVGPLVSPQPKTPTPSTSTTTKQVVGPLVGPLVSPQPKTGFLAATGATQQKNLMVSSTSSSGKKITL